MITKIFKPGVKMHFTQWLKEMFFTEPHHLLERYPDLYGALSRFYRQDPALRLPR